MSSDDEEMGTGDDEDDSSRDDKSIADWVEENCEAHGFTTAETEEMEAHVRKHFAKLDRDGKWQELIECLPKKQEEDHANDDKFFDAKVDDLNEFAASNLEEFDSMMGDETAHKKWSPSKMQDAKDGNGNAQFDDDIGL